ncbi:MAG: hypothetical protein EBS29_03240 [Chloroflexia bacterium]|nr:hypothetical protein [Chloroflexia bacterium]
MHIASLSYALESLSLSDRATVAAVHGCDELQMVSVLSQVATWQRLLRQLDRPARALLDRIRRAGGHVPMALGMAVGGPLRTNMATLSPRTLLVIHPRHSPLETLLMAGLVWPVAHDNGHWAVLPDIEALLPPPLPILTVPESVELAGDAGLPRDDVLLQIACLAFDGRIPLQHHGKVSQVVVNRIAIDGVTVPYVQWLVATLLAGGALKAQANIVVPTQLLLEWLAMPAHMRQQELARAWLQAAWSEWELGPKRRPPPLDVRLVRRTMLQAVLPHFPDEWCAIDDIIAQLRLSWPDVMRPLPLDGRWKLPAGWPAHWDEEEGQLMRYMLIGPLAWLGLVEWAGNGLYIRRTGLGAWHAGLAVMPASQPAQGAVLEPDWRVVVPDMSNMYVRFQLHRIADWHDAATAQISPARVKRAITQGMTLLEYIDVLAQITHQPVPMELQLLLRRWVADVAQISLTNVVMVQCNDTAVIQDIQHDRRIHLPTYEVLDATRIILNHTDAIGVARRLRHAGYLIDIQQLRPSQFDDAELTTIDAALQQIVAPSEAIRTIRRRIAQMRTIAGDNHG